MKFTKIQLRGLTDVHLKVVGALPTDPFVLKAADGLGPPEVAVSISSTQHMGGVYQGRRPLNREIVLRIGLNPAYSTGQTADDLRTQLYGLLTPGFDDFVTVFIVDERLVGEQTRAVTKGWVKRLEVVPFSKDPEVQVTIACEKPFLEAAGELISITSAETTRNPISVVNAGTAETGIVINVSFNTAGATEFSLKRSDATEIMRLKRPAGFPSGSVLHIDSRPGERTVTLSGAGLSPLEYNHAWIVNPLSVWPMLHGGQNHITGQAYASNGSAFTGWVWGALQYRPLFWGI